MSEIDFNELPKQFVLKTNCSSGDVIIVQDKFSLSAKDICGYKKKLEYYLTMKYGYVSFEPHYNMIEPKIIAEKYIKPDVGENLQDYKFLCFNGIPQYIWVDTNRYHGHRRNIYDTNWNLQNWRHDCYKQSNETIDKTSNLDEMLDIVRRLSSGFEHVRVDLYNVNGKIYFGEMTFTNASGLAPIEPKKIDLMLGDLWNVNISIPDMK